MATDDCGYSFQIWRDLKNFQWVTEFYDIETGEVVDHDLTPFYSGGLLDTQIAAFEHVKEMEMLDAINANEEQRRTS